MRSRGGGTGCKGQDKSHLYYRPGRLAGLTSPVINGDIVTARNLHVFVTAATNKEFSNSLDF